MPDEVDDLILQMQHLEAAAKASQESRAQGNRAAKWKTQAQKLAAEAQDELAAAEKQQAEGEAELAQAHQPGMPTLQAADLLMSGKQKAQDGKTRAVKARARLNFALDQMDEAERGEWQAMQAEARAETHAQLAASGDDSSRMPDLAAPPPIDPGDAK